MQIGIYFDNHNTVILNPIFLHPIGYGISSSSFIKLDNGWTIFDLTNAIKECLKISEANNLVDTEGENFWTKATGIKGYATFSKKHRCIMVDYDIRKDCYTVGEYLRCKDGSYGVSSDNFDSQVKTYPGIPINESIGEKVVQALR